jgi:excinuclease ABC subunit C
LANKNAKVLSDRNILKRRNDLTSRVKAIRKLQEALEMEKPPFRIECYDISHTGGSNQVASMVVFEDGLPIKKDYRSFNIRSISDADDTAAIYEAITRRLGKRKEWQLPDLIVIDGGEPQVNAAQRAYNDYVAIENDTVKSDEIDDNKAEVDRIKICSLAKRLEEVWIANIDDPILLPRNSEVLYLLQFLRDESHRFAHLKHSRRRDKISNSSIINTKSKNKRKI